MVSGILMLVEDPGSVTGTEISSLPSLEDIKALKWAGGEDGSSSFFPHFARNAWQNLRQIARILTILGK